MSERPRIVELPDGDTATYQGWKEIANALGVDFKAAYRASRRAVDPLRVRYDAFDRPWIYRSWLSMWVADNDRSAKVYDNERQSKGAALRKAAAE